MPPLWVSVWGDGRQHKIVVSHDFNCVTLTSDALLTMSALEQIYAARWLLMAIAFALYGVSRYRAYRRLVSFGGPFSTGWSELWHTRAILSNRSHLAYQKATDKYGKLQTAERP